MDWLGQKGMWSDGRLLKMAQGKTVTAFWEEVTTEKEKPALFKFMMGNLSYVVDSGDAERIWVLFQTVDHKGSLSL